MTAFDDVGLTWDCLYCGLATPTPDAHLRRAHGLTAESVADLLDRRDRAARLADDRLLTRATIDRLFGLPVVERDDL